MENNKKIKNISTSKSKNSVDNSLLKNDIVKTHDIKPVPEGDHIAIKLVNVTKTFLNGTVKANTNISFEIFKNEVHALIGENGAGKSTLTSIIFGLYEQDYGDIYVWGKKVKFKSASDARKHKIGMVHQHFKLVDEYTVLENIILGVEPSKFGFINYSKAKRKINELIEKYNFNLNIDDKISNLTVGQQQKVEILKLLFIDSEILILDEPTAVLSDNEIEAFLQMVKDFKKEGKTIIIISHKLNEIKEVADFATVIRHGSVIGHFDVKKSTIKELAEAMVGRTLKTIKNDSSLEFGEVILDIKDLPLSLLKNPNARVGITKFGDKLLYKLQWSTASLLAKKFFYTFFYDYPKYFLRMVLYYINPFNWLNRIEKPKLKFTIQPTEEINFNEEKISFQIRAGEIFAIAGVQGNGQSEFVEYLSGLKKAPHDTIFIKNKFKKESNKEINNFGKWFYSFINKDHLLNNNYIDISNKPIMSRYKWDLSFIPEDRHKHGLFLDESISFNSISNQLYKKEFSKFGFLQFSAINNNALNIIDEFDVRGVSSLQDDVRGLSGGNQQKLIVGREIRKNSDFIIFTQPTRGLDLGAIEYIHGRILQAKKEMKAVLLVSYELDEILSLADTIAVFNKNKIVGIGDRKIMTRNKIAELMAQSSSIELNQGKGE